MIELLASAAPILGVAAGVAGYVAHSYRKELVEARLDLTIARSDISSLTKRVNDLTNRATNLRGDNIAQQKTIDTLREGHDRLVDERDEAVRELGRLKAEMVAAKPKRGKGGRFVAKPKAPKPIKPIACG